MSRLVKNVLIANLPQDQRITVLSPAVGTYYKAPEPGAYLKAGSFAGVLKILNSLYRLHIPEEACGFVSQIKVNNLANPVEFKQELFSLIQDQPTDDLIKTRAATKEESKDTSLQGRPAGSLSIFSPTEGIFYRRANSTAEPFVCEGDIINSGAVLGLVEIMKSFNQIRFAGPDYPEKAKVTQILVEDGAEVKLGEVLFWLEPV